jgi:hypothetical protein
MLAFKLLVTLVGAANSVELVNGAAVVLAVAFKDVAEDTVVLLDELKFAD